MREPSIIPRANANQVMLTENDDGTIHLSVHRIGSHSSIDLSCVQALELADDLRFRALAMEVK
jgi:hypothetical protein